MVTVSTKESPNNHSMAASFARTSCPRGQNKIMGMVEAGMDTDEIAQALQETAERKTLALTEGNDEYGMCCLLPIKRKSQDLMHIVPA